MKNNYQIKIQNLEDYLFSILKFQVIVVKKENR